LLKLLRLVTTSPALAKAACGGTPISRANNANKKSENLFIEFVVIGNY
jgi:hypothetical protein